MHIETANLKRAFDSVRHVTEGGSKLVPYHGNVRLFTPEGGRLVLTARDEAMEATDAIACEGESMDLCISANRIATVLLSAGAAVSIEQKDEKVVVKSGRSRHTIACMPGNVMPQINLDGVAKPRVKASGIGAALASIAWAAAKGRLDIPAINGVHIDASPDGITVVATDGGMLATNRCDVETELKAEDRFQATISTAAAQRVIALAPESLEFRPGALCFFREERQLTVKTLAFPYPDWRRLIPEVAGSIKAKREEFLLAVTTASSYDDTNVTAKDKTMRTVMLKSDGKRLVVYSPGEKEGCRHEIEVEGYAVEAAYRAMNLVRALNEHDGDEVELLFAKRDSTVFLRINHDDWRFLSSPMKV